MTVNNNGNIKRCRLWKLDLSIEYCIKQKLKA